MLYLVTGDNQLGIKNFIRGRRSNFTSSNIYDKSSAEGGFTPAEIMDIVSSTTMFGGGQLVILYPSSTADVDFNENFLNQIANDNENELIIDATKLVKTSKIYKKIKTYARLMEFKEKADYLFFNIADAYYLEKNPKRALELLESAPNIETQFSLLVAALETSLKNILSYKYQNSIWQKLHPFIKKKITANKKNIDAYTETELQTEFARLLDLDVQLKTSATGSGAAAKKAIIRDYMLYSV